MALATGAWRENLARSVLIQVSSSATSGALSSWRTAWRRDRRRVLAHLAGRNVGELEELPPRVREAWNFSDRPRQSRGRVEAVVAGETVGLEDTGERLQVLDWMIAGPIPRVAEQRCRRVQTAERPVVADIDPGPAFVGLAFGKHRHRRVVAMQAFGRQHMGRNEVVQRAQRHRAGAHLVGQGGQAEVDAFARIAVALAVQRLVLPVLLEDDRRQQVGASPATGHRVERHRRLADLLAVPAGELLAHRLDDLPLARNNLQGLGDVLADLGQLLRAAARAGGRWRHHHALARQMSGERLAPGPAAAGERLHLGRAGRRLFGP